MATEVCSFKVLSASGVVGDSGKAIDIAGCNVVSGATAAQPFFKNGAAVSAPTVFQPGPMTISVANDFDFSVPRRFPLGLFVSFDANTTTVTVYYTQAAT